MITLDARNMDCPEPVVLTKKALESMTDDKLIVLVNSSTSRENVQRFAKNQGYEVKVSENSGEYILEITRGQPAAENLPAGQPAGKEPSGQPVILVAGDLFGIGDESLGQLLMAAFINTLPESKIRPAKIIFMNRGVFLTTEGSRVLPALQQLENEGVEIFSCGTCLNHYKLKEKLRAGKITNMYDTVENLLAAEKVIRI